MMRYSAPNLNNDLVMAIAALAAIGFRRLCYEGERQPAGAKAE